LAWMGLNYGEAVLDLPMQGQIKSRGKGFQVFCVGPPIPLL
jgi:hypothetical protein